MVIDLGHTVVRGRVAPLVAGSTPLSIKSRSHADDGRRIHCEIRNMPDVPARLTRSRHMAAFMWASHAAVHRRIETGAVMTTNGQLFGPVGTRPNEATGDPFATSGR